MQGAEGCQPVTRASRRCIRANTAATKRRKPHDKGRQPLQRLPPLPEEVEVAESQAAAKSQADGAAPRASAEQAAASGAPPMPSLCSAATLLYGCFLAMSRCTACLAGYDHRLDAKVQPLLCFIPSSAPNFSFKPC